MFTTISKAVVFFNACVAFMLLGFSLFTFGSSQSYGKIISDLNKQKQDLDARSADIDKGLEEIKKATSAKEADLLKIRELATKAATESSKLNQGIEDEVNATRVRIDAMQKELNEVLLPKQKKLRETVLDLKELVGKDTEQNRALKQKKAELENELTQVQNSLKSLQARLEGLQKSVQ